MRKLYGMKALLSTEGRPRRDRCWLTKIQKPVPMEHSRVGKKIDPASRVRGLKLELDHSQWVTGNRLFLHQIYLACLGPCCFIDLPLIRAINAALTCVLRVACQTRGLSCLNGRRFAATFIPQYCLITGGSESRRCCLCVLDVILMGEHCSHSCGLTTLSRSSHRPLA